MEVLQQPEITDAYRSLVAPLIEEAALLDEEYARTLLEHLAAMDLQSFYPEDMNLELLQHGAVEIDSSRRLLPLVLSIRMLGLLGVTKRMRVLEVGCGNGLVCALLCRLGAEVFGVEQAAALVQRARKTLDKHHFEGVLLRRGSSSSGWDDYAPYDRILVSAPREEIDKKLLSQLDPKGGRLVALEKKDDEWSLVLVEAVNDTYRKTSFETVSID